MSHVVSIAVRLNDLEAVKATCKELGLLFKHGQTSYRWYGSSVGDYPLPTGFTAEDLGKCEHAIEVPGAGYDIGLARAKDGNGWEMLFDFWGPGAPILKAIGDANCTAEQPNGNRFIQHYSANKAENVARKQGYRVSRQVAKNGTINVVCTGRSY